MSKLTETTRLRAEDFQKQKDWITPIFDAYNNFLGQTRNLLNSGLTFSDNAVGLQHDFVFTFQTQAISFPQKVKWPYDRFSPKNLFATFSSEDSIPIPVVVSWKFTDDRFVQLKSVYKITAVPAIADLASGSDYVIRVRIEP